MGQQKETGLRGSSPEILLYKKVQHSTKPTDNIVKNYARNKVLLLEQLNSPIYMGMLYHFYASIPSTQVPK